MRIRYEDLDVVDQSIVIPHITCQSFQRVTKEVFLFYCYRECYLLSYVSS